MSNADETLGWPTLPPGTILREKYRIERVLGTGGMAVVYAVTHRNRKRFALKMLHPELAIRRELRARFVREGYLANSVEHPAVVEVLDDDVDEHGAVFLVMELLDGVSAEALYRPPSSTLPVREALELAEQLLDVLERAHAKSIVHRDIKPSNLFVTREGKLKVLDFGVARLRDDASVRSTHTGTTLGTPAFMAPEQALAQGSEVDARTDLWSVGATLFTLLSGQHLHMGDNAREIMVRCATQPPRSLTSVMPEAPLELVQLLDHALRFDKSERFESAAVMRKAVNDVQLALFGAAAHGGLAALVGARCGLGSPPAEQQPNEVLADLFYEPVPQGSDVAAPAARKRTVPVAFAVAMALGLGAVASLLLARDRPLDHPTVAVAPQRNATSAPAPLPDHGSITTLASALTPSPPAVRKDPEPKALPPGVSVPRRAPVAVSHPDIAGTAARAPEAARPNPLHLEIQ
jgi:serine/threonine-protein kinase